MCVCFLSRDRTSFSVLVPDGHHPNLRVYIVDGPSRHTHTVSLLSLRFTVNRILKRDQCSLTTTLVVYKGTKVWKV